MIALPRSFHRAYAFLLRYFWIPCPLCHECFGGHEWKDRNGQPSQTADGKGICPACTRSGRGSHVVRHAV